MPSDEPGSRFSPSNWRVRTKLNAILLIPVIVALVVGGFNVKSAVDRWQEADNAYRTAVLVRAAETYSHDVINERDVSVVPLLKGDTKNPDVIAARNATDQAAQAYHAAVAQAPDTASLKRRLAGVAAAEPKLAYLRQYAFTAKLPAVQTEEGYVQIEHPLMYIANEMGFGTNNQISFGRSLYALSLAEAAESLTRSIGMHILSEGPTPQADRRLQMTALASYAYLENIAVEEFHGSGTPADWARFQAAVKNAQADGKAQLVAAKAKAQAAGQPFVMPPDRITMIKAIAAGTPASALLPQGITPESYFATSTLAFNTYRTVEQQTADQATASAQQIASDAKTNAIVNSAAVLAGVLMAFLVAGLMARGMSRGMRRLRTAAFDVAEQRLPALVDQLSRTDPGRVDTRVLPIPISSNDEIGEVARAFDQVHREAVRLASEQALLRGNVNAIFTNLSMRNQGLIQRQLELITDLEGNEGDPDQLENLFKLDHLATRMRRNGENLLVLAGQEPGRRWNEPVPLVDVLRAAASEVESYERIEITGVPETDIHGGVVTDLVHLLAELLENAISFSSPRTKVRVTATRLPDGRIMVEIHDKGIGLTAEDFADINHKLADPPTVDAEVSKRMGLFVVGRLADRHGIRVQLRPSGEQAGTTSLVMLPESITHGGMDMEPEDDFTVSRIMPEHQNRRGEFHSGELTAAELGFDERQFENPESIRALDPIGRSRMREERRAAVEAAAQDRQPTPELQAPAGQDFPAIEPAYQAEEQSYGSGQYTGEQGYGNGQGYAAEQGYQQPYQESADTGAYQAYGQSYDPAFEQQYDGGYGNGQQSAYETTGSHPAPAASPESDYGTQGWSQGYQQESWSATVPEPESSFPAQERVGYDAPDSGDSTLTGSGLPRRNRRRQEPEAAAPQPEAAPEDTRTDLRTSSGAGGQGGQQDAGEWRSANDAHWQRAAERARDPKAGGVTSAGLPRRVPQANLVAGAPAASPSSTGSMVSRAPEDVRGRLSNLRRGVQQGRQGRGAGSQSTPTDSQGLGPNHQER